MNYTYPFSNRPKTSPLVLDRVLEGRPIAAQHSPLLRIPVEILPLIMEHIETDRTSLAAFAHVNSDCRQLARSCQFQNIVLDYNYRSYCLFGVLIREATERAIDVYGLTCKPSLGACIRHIKATNKHHRDEIEMVNQLRLWLNWGRGFGSPISLDQWSDLCYNLSTKVGNIYDASLGFVLASLPNLDTFNWTKGITIDRHIFNCLTVSTISHLRLWGYIYSDILTVEFEGRNSWPLLSLDIDIRLAPYVLDKNHPFDSSPFFNSLFQACSSTLGYLRLSHQEHYGEGYQMPISTTAEFPRLFFLHLTHKTPISRSTLQKLLQSQQLSILAVEFGDPTIRGCLNEIGYYPSLQTFFWTGFQIPETASLRALEQNDQLTAFGIECRQEISTIERLLSILSSFSNLKTLSLKWSGYKVPDDSLLAIASITSLENLHMSSGCQYGWQHNWFIDHGTVQNRLSPLRRLKMLLLTRDSYPLNDLLQGSDVDAYYYSRVATPDDISNLRSDFTGEEQRRNNFSEMVWEMVHRMNMVRHASSYLITFPGLEFIHFGQLSFSFKHNVYGRNGNKIPGVVNPYRNENFPVRETMFGICDS